MTIQQFEEISLYVSLAVLVSYVLFMLYGLAKEAGAGRHAIWVIFMTLGLGVTSFFIKSVVETVI